MNVKADYDVDAWASDHVKYSEADPHNMTSPTVIHGPNTFVRRLGPGEFWSNPTLA